MKTKLSNWWDRSKSTYDLLVKFVIALGRSEHAGYSIRSTEVSEGQLTATVYNWKMKKDVTLVYDKKNRSWARS